MVAEERPPSPNLEAIEKKVIEAVLRNPVIKYGKMLLAAAITGGFAVWVGGTVIGGIQVASVRNRAAESISQITVANERVAAFFDSIAVHVQRVDSAVAVATALVASKHASVVAAMDTAVGVAVARIDSAVDSVAAVRDSFVSKTDLGSLKDLPVLDSILSLRIQELDNALSRERARLEAEIEAVRRSDGQIDLGVIRQLVSLWWIPFVFSSIAMLAAAFSVFIVLKPKH